MFWCAYFQILLRVVLMDVIRKKSDVCEWKNGNVLNVCAFSWRVYNFFIVLSLIFLVVFISFFLALVPFSSLLSHFLLFIMDSFFVSCFFSFPLIIFLILRLLSSRHILSLPLISIAPLSPVFPIIYFLPSYHPSLLSPLYPFFHLYHPSLHYPPYFPLFQLYHLSLSLLPFSPEI